MSVTSRFLASRMGTTLARRPRLLEILRLTRNSGFRAPAGLWNTLYYSQYGNVVVYPNTQITGARWFSISGKLTVGRPIRLLMHPSDKTLVDLHGPLDIRGEVSVGKGCRIWVGEGANCALEECYISGDTLAFIRHGLTIGAGSAISWGCQFLDDDWNALYYPAKRLRPPHIVIGQRVWIGSNVSVLKGVTVGDGCVVASGSVLTAGYPAHCLIGGNPARVLKENIRWGKDALEMGVEATNAVSHSEAHTGDSACLVNRA
jgi:acetyltransferase-like isoleucine patch superfamily enzyme